MCLLNIKVATREQEDVRCVTVSRSFHDPNLEKGEHVALTFPDGEN